MYLYTTVQVSGHVFVYYCSSERSCICILLFKIEVMCLYTTVQASGHVFVYYSSSERSFICILRFK
jgi:RNA-binding protein YhbY